MIAASEHQVGHSPVVCDAPGDEKRRFFASCPTWYTVVDGQTPNLDIALGMENSHPDLAATDWFLSPVRCRLTISRIGANGAESWMGPKVELEAVADDDGIHGQRVDLERAGAGSSSCGNDETHLCKGRDSHEIVGQVVCGSGFELKCPTGQVVEAELPQEAQPCGGG